MSLLVGGIIKQCLAKFLVRMLKFHAFVPVSRICLGFSRRYIFSELISLLKPHTHVSTVTVARWITNVLADCGIITKKFTAGSARLASASQATAMDVPVPILFSKAGWTQETTFPEHYTKEFTPVSDSSPEAIPDSVL